MTPKQSKAIPQLHEGALYVIMCLSSGPCQPQVHLHQPSPGNTRAACHQRTDCLLPKSYLHATGLRPAPHLMQPVCHLRADPLLVHVTCLPKPQHADSAHYACAPDIARR